MDILFLVIGIAIGMAAAYFILNRKLTDARVHISRLEATVEIERKQHADKLQTILAEQEAREQMQQEQQEARERMMQQQQEARERILHEQQEARERMQREQFEKQLQTVKEQFSNLAAKILDSSAERLKAQNAEAMGIITQPLKDNLEQLGKAIQTTNQETARSTASLSEQLRQMAQQTEKIDKTANRLTNVMRGSNKIQGNWGELILTEILEQNGFREGINYDVQQTLTDDKGNTLLGDESGRRMVPDVILHYPKNEDVVIDAKMSIEAYEQWVGAEDDVARKKYADDLARSVRTQMMGLAKKDYSSYIKPPRHAIDFVIMFVPNEGALQLALATDKRLWADAFERRVFITSQQNLMAILKMIEIAWRQYTQSENQQRVYGLAEELLKRVGEFIKRFDKVKKDIETLHKDYDDAYSKAYTGRQSIVQKANELKQLGVKESANQPIPPTEMELIGEEE